MYVHIVLNRTQTKKQTPLLSSANIMARQQIKRLFPEASGDPSINQLHRVKASARIKRGDSGEISSRNTRKRSDSRKRVVSTSKAPTFRSFSFFIFAARVFFSIDVGCNDNRSREGHLSSRFWRTTCVAISCRATPDDKFHVFTVSRLFTFARFPYLPPGYLLSRIFPRWNGCVRGCHFGSALESSIVDESF